MSDSVQPHRWQPTRLSHPWDSPGKNTRVGCHFPLQCMKVKSESKVSQSCLTLSDPRDRSLPGSSVHEIFQARVLEWGAIEGSFFSTPSPAFIAYRLLDCSHSDWCEMLPHCGFDLHFSDNEWCWAYFHVFVSHPACVSSSPAFLMMYCAYKLNKQGDNIQPWRTPFLFGTSLLFHVQF